MSPSLQFGNLYPSNIKIKPSGFYGYKKNQQAEMQQKISTL